MPKLEIDKFLIKLSARLDRENRNEVWLRIWLESQSKKQGQKLQCPKCSAFVPLRPDNFAENGKKRICLLCGIKFFPKKHKTA